jgi:transmembrane 9 superfamily member 2/4
MHSRHSLRFSSLLSAAALLAPLPSSAFYLPGAAPTNYAYGDKVPLQVNSLTPADTEGNQQVHSVYSFDYYHPAFHFCQPSGGPKWISESLGSILFGDRIQTSPFVLNMGINETCKPVCEPQTFPQDHAVFVNQRIRQGYDINWLIDGLPAGQLFKDTQTNTAYESVGFPLGSGVDGKPVLNNHYDILVEYHEASKGAFRVVGIEVIPSSRANNKYVSKDKAECGNDKKPMVLQENKDTKVTYTYGIYWRESSTSFATRWDKYLHVYDPRIHWFSLINSAVIVVFLVGMVSTILVRTLRKDFVRYNRLDIAMEDLNGGDAEDGIQEDSGWKLVHGDVFRPPRNPLLLSVMVGNGAQLFMMAGFTIGEFSRALRPMFNV